MDKAQYLEGQLIAYKTSNMLKRKNFLVASLFACVGVGAAVMSLVAGELIAANL